MNVLQLKGKRVASGFKQKEVAEILGITPKTFCIYENCPECKFSPEQIKKLSELYKLDLKDVNFIFYNNSLSNGNKETY